MERWDAAPIRYALAVIRFPVLMDMEAHVPAFQDAIREIYPLSSDCLNQGIDATAGPNGLAFGLKTIKMWQFADLDRSHAVILGPDFILMHAGQAYDGHTDFLDRFRDAISVFLATPGMKVGQSTAVGFRYIDVVEPMPGGKPEFSDYLEPWSLPIVAPSLNGDAVKFQEGMYVSSFATGQGAVRYMAWRRAGGACLPPELDTPFVRENGWMENDRTSEYVILDIDHFASFATPVVIDADDMRRRFETMHGPLQQIFRAASTPYARQLWGMKE